MYTETDIIIITQMRQQIYFYCHTDAETVINIVTQMLNIYQYCHTDFERNRYQYWHTDAETDINTVTQMHIIPLKGTPKQ
jgi:hypothetical protein